MTNVNTAKQNLDLCGCIPNKNISVKLLQCKTNQPHKKHFFQNICIFALSSVLRENYSLSYTLKYSTETPEGQKSGYFCLAFEDPTSTVEWEATSLWTAAGTVKAAMIGSGRAVLFVVLVFLKMLFIAPAKKGDRFPRVPGFQSKEKKNSRWKIWSGQTDNLEKVWTQSSSDMQKLIHRETTYDMVIRNTGLSHRRPLF